eukprot:scaffold10404_cov117-Isochrysis_galbana.AAC.4
MRGNIALPQFLSQALEALHALALTQTSLSRDGILSQPIWDNRHHPPPKIPPLIPARRVSSRTRAAMASWQSAWARPLRTARPPTLWPCARRMLCSVSMLPPALSLIATWTYYEAHSAHDTPSPTHLPPFFGAQEARVQDETRRDPTFFAREVAAHTRTSEALVRVCREADAISFSRHAARWQQAWGPLGPCRNTTSDN